MIMFGVFMTFFLFGFGFFFLFAQNLYYIEKFYRILVGSTLIIYGFYRAYITYRKIIEVFFSKGKDES